MKANEFRQMTVEALKQEKLALLREQCNLRMQKASGQAVGPNRLKLVRRDIARIETILTEMKTGETHD